MRSLITGLSGFVGRHLAALLLARGDEVYGTIHRPTSRGISLLGSRHCATSVCTPLRLPIDRP